MHLSKIEPQTLYLLLEDIAREAQAIFWMMTPDYKNQLYVSANFKEIWGRSCEQLYLYPESWITTLNANDRDNVSQLMQSRIDQKPQSNQPTYCKSMLFRAEKPNGDVLFIRDRAFIISNENQPPLLAGIGQVLSAHEWAFEKDLQVITNEHHNHPLEQALITIMRRVLSQRI